MEQSIAAKPPDSDLVYKVHCAARDGMVITIFANLANKPKDELCKILSTKTEEHGQTTTPLIIAARNGHVKVVRLLLEHFDVNIEEVGTVKFDGYVIEGATALWCSAGAGHDGVVRTLLEAGADVNHATFSNSTPLRAACFDGRLDIVRHLIDNKADLHIPNKYNNTCLMIASYKGHKDVVTFLLEHGANPDSKAHCGATALHFAAERGFLPIVEELIRCKAAVVLNDQGMTPLQIAAESSRTDIVEFFISRKDCTKKERIEALELLGASFANDKDNYSIEKSYRYLWLAMKERLFSKDPALKKVIQAPVSAYGNRTECATIAELEEIEGDAEMLHMEALMVRERILGEDNVEIPHPIIFRGAVFADNALFDRCTSLWLRALELRYRNKRSISKDLLRFAQVFSQMLHVGVELDPSLVMLVLQYALGEFERDKLSFQKLQGDDLKILQEINEANILTALYLITIMTKVKLAKVQEFQLCKQVLCFNKLGMSLQNSGVTPLHMVLDETTLVDDFHVNDIVKFPNEKVARLLIKCGANVNATSKNGDTPLHVIVRYSRPIYDFLTLHNVIITLLEEGAHFDICNKERKTPLQACGDQVSEMILRSQNYISLKCLCARVVREQHIDYVGQIPITLEEFVEMH